MRRGTIALLLVALLAAAPLLPVSWDAPVQGPGDMQEVPPAVPAASDASDVTGAMSQLAQSFVENLGQLDNPDVRFYTQGGPLSVGLMRGGVMFTIREGPVGAERGTDLLERPSRSLSFSMLFEGCDAVEPVGVAPQGHDSNFFRGGDPARWVSGARSFSEVVYRGIYDGVDLRYYFKDGTLKYDYSLDSASDASRIAHRFIGIDRLVLDGQSGEVQVVTALGALRDTRPVILSGGIGGGMLGRAGFALLGPTSCGFELPEGLRAATDIVIDPGLIWSTYFGGWGMDGFGTIAEDDDGDLYLGGATMSPDFPTTPGVHDGTGNATSGADGADGFIIKLDPSGGLLFSTFIGGPREDMVDNLLHRADGTLIIAGCTKSNGSAFPLTSDAVQKQRAGPSDLFLALLSDDGKALRYCSFLGGEGCDEVVKVRLGEDESVYCCFGTNSTDLDATPGAYCSTFEGEGGSVAAFLMRLDRTLRNVSYGTYINCSFDLSATSSSELGTNPYGLEVGRTGIVYFASATNSSLITTTPGAFSESYQGGDADGFVMKLDPRGNGASDLLASTYIGGTSYDGVEDLAVGPDGLVFLTGVTFSRNFPTTPDAHSLDRQGYSDGFLTVLEGDLSDARYSTYFGGNQGDNGASLVLDPRAGTVCIFGSSSSTFNFNMTEGCYDPTSHGGANFVPYILVFNTTRPAIEYGTFLGYEPGDDYSFYWFSSYDILFIDHLGNVIVAFSTMTNAEVPTTPGAYARNHLGDADAVLMKLDPHPGGLPSPPINLTATPGDHSAALAWEPHTDIGYRVLGYTLYSATSPEGPYQLVAFLSETTMMYEVNGLVNGATYYYFLSANNSMGEGSTANASVRPLGPATCPLNLTATANKNGTVSLSWSPPRDDGGEVLRYYIRRGLHRTSLDPLDGTDATGYLDADPRLRMGTMHFYEVVAYNGAGNGTPNQTFVTPICLPTAPSHLRAEPGDGRVSITWDPPASDGGSELLGYRLYRGFSLYSWVMLQELQDTTGFYEDPAGLVNGDTYFYKVTAFTLIGEGPASEPANATPFGRPGAPRDLAAAPGNTHVALSWAPPEFENGRPVKVYLIYRGTSRTNLLSVGSTNQTGYNDTGLHNGWTYFYQVAAENEAGEGARCLEVASATPYGIPGAPVGFCVTVVQGGVRLNWTAPAQTGGAEHLTYTVLRGGSPDSLAPDREMTDAFETTDLAVSPGGSYYYSVSARNALWAGTKASPKGVTYVVPPGAIGNLSTTPGDCMVRLKWSAPADDGGSVIESYTILRGLRGDGKDLSRVGEADRAEYTDAGGGLENGRTYYYSVVPRNWRWEGPASELVNATPITTPPMPDLSVKRSGGRAELRWSMPGSSGTAPATGFIVWRGPSPQVMVPIAWLGVEYKYVDTDVEAGRTYYYQVVPTSQVGEGTPSQVGSVTIEPAASRGWMAPMLIIVLVAVVCVALVLRARARRSAEAEAPPPAEPAGLAIPPVEVTVAAPPSCVVEEVFVVHHDGQLIASSAREGRRAEDADLMSGMLIAVQGIVQDGLRREGELESIKYGQSVVLIAAGAHVNLAVVVYGEPDEGLKDELEATVRRIETSYAGVIEQWGGDLSQLPGIEGLLQALVKRTERVTREEVLATVPTPAVSALSAVDFYRGYVRLKVAAVNDTFGIIADAVMEVEYDDSMLRLDRVEPSGLRLRGNRVAIGTIRPGERKTVAFFFDPQICQGSYLDGYLAYFDPEGQRHRVEMKRRTAEVVCPIFFTREQANTAMLRRLISESLRASDLRAFRFPQDMEPAEAFKVGKLALGGFEVQSVREFVEEGPPYEAEAWFYGETKVKGFKMAMRLAVVEDRQALEFFVASTAMEPITGMLAEFRRELDRVLDERYKGAVKMEARADEDLRRELAGRETLMDRSGKDDGEGDSQAGPRQGPLQGKGGA